MSTTTENPEAPQKRPAAPIPDGVTLITSGTLQDGVEVPTDEFEERGEYITELVKYIEYLIPHLAPVKNGLPTDADDILTPVQAASFLQKAATELDREIIQQANCALLVAQDVLADVASESEEVSRGSSVNRYVRNQPHIDGGASRRAQIWRHYSYERPELATPPGVPEPQTFERFKRSYA